MSNLVIAAIPDENDRVWKVSSEKIPHLTLLFLGDVNNVSNLEKIMMFVEHAANTTLQRFYLPVDRRGELGPDKADVLFFKKGRYDYKAIRDFRATLLQEPNIKTAYDSATQFEGPWTPHLTLGYPAAPAKPMPDEFTSSFYDVSFNKIAVWTGDFEGPEFLLKDYWDEFDTLELMPTDVAMSSLNEARIAAGLEAIEHHGVKGMKWGRRTKTPSVVSQPKSVLTTNQRLALAGVGVFALANKSIREGQKKDVAANKGFQKDKKWEKDFQKAKGFGFDDQKFTKDYNAKFKDHDFSKEDWNNPSPTYKKYQDGYMKEMNTEYAKQFAAHYGSSPSGKYEAHHEPGTDLVKLRQKDTAQHAEIGVLVTFRIKLDNANGLITGLEKVDDSMAQTAELGEEHILEHFGVKGMKWGVRKENIKSGAKAVGRGLNKAATALGDHNFEAMTQDGRAATLVEHEGHTAFRRTDLPKINAKPEYQDAKKLTHRLRNPKDPKTKQYRNEVKVAYIRRLEGAANAQKNASGTRQYTIRERGWELPPEGGKLPTSKHLWTVSSREVKHAVDNPDKPFYVELTIDQDGFVTDLAPITPMVHSIETGEEFVLEHFGIKGMKWGVRNRRPAPTAVTPTASSKVPHGTRRKTKIETQGGENHPAHEDAIKVAKAQAKLKKSGTSALSNQELRDVATRVQLENQVSLLTGHKGKQFAKRQLESTGQQTVQRGITRGIATGAAKKGGKAALLFA